MARTTRSISTILLTILAMVIAMATAALGTGAAVAATPADPTKVPHYFGPWPNWANSPLTLNKASVKFGGAGTGASAVAQVDPATGGIKSVDITAPGQGYDAATTVTISGGTTAAAATAAVSTSDVVTGFTDVVPGCRLHGVHGRPHRRRGPDRHRQRGSDRDRLRAAWTP